MPNIVKPSLSINSIMLLFITVAIILTPHIPMPTGELGPVGPAIYLSLFSLLIIIYLILGKLPKFISNRFILFFIFIQISLLILDAVNFIRHDFLKELNYFLIRLTNLGVFLIFSYVIIDKSRYKDYFMPSRYILSVFYYSIVLISILLLLQSFGIITFGKVFRPRTYFGVRLPFYKPLGLFELSDGKLGIIVVAGFYLSLLSSVKKLRFVKLLFPKVFSIIFLITIVILQSRSTYLAFVLSFMIFILLYPVKKFRWTNYFILSVALIFSLSGNFGNKLWIGLKGEGIFERNVSARATTIKRDILAWKKNPVFGNANRGVKNILLIDKGAGSHNIFTNHLAVGGIVSFFLFSSLFILYFHSAWKSYKLSLRFRNIRVAAFSLFCICTMIHAFFELNFYRGLYNEYLYFLFSLGIILNLNNNVMLSKIYTNEDNYNVNIQH